MSYQFDVIVIGSGPGGYVAAIRCAQLGMKTAIVERYPKLGGTCLNVGCIPSKAMLDSSEHYFNAVHHFKAHGIDISGNIQPNLAQMIQRKNDVVNKTVEGINFLMKKNKITVFIGHGTFVNTNTLAVQKSDGTSESITATHFIIATGSKPATVPGIPLDKKRIICSTEALNLPEIPKQILLIGGGVIGLEMGSVYARLGSKVKVIEYTDSIIPSMDRDLGKEMQKILQKELGFEFYYQHKVTSITNHGDSVSVTAETNGKIVNFDGDYCLVAVGRRPYTENLGLETVGIELDNRGR
ncbi:MAG: FAD-dependent oxidoreductase, partial [Bacteroidia bacterium]|nr:FAD-dependent oxidoreductase [Bacteroidia bacterium]